MLLFRAIFILSFIFLTTCTSKTQVPVSTVNNNPASPVGKPLAKPISKTEVQAGIETNRVATRVASMPAENIKTKMTENSGASNISSWELSGAMAARSKNKGWSASINWIQRGSNDYQIRLSGPIGSGTMMINRSGGTVTYREGAKTVTSSSAESLLAQQTGISLPVSKLFYWVRGKPAPGAVQGKRYDQSGNLIALSQAGYTIEYQRYSSYGQYILPSSIRLQGNGVSIKLVIKNWRI